MNAVACSACFLFAVVVLACFPASVSAQTADGPVTRAQVLQHLADLEDVGYRSSQASSLRYPYDIEAAETRLAEKKREQTSGMAPNSKP